MARKWTRPEKPEYDQDVHRVLNALAGMSANKIACQTWVSASTIAKWRRGYEHGGTRHPEHSTLSAVAAVAGLRFTLVPERVQETRKVRSIASRRGQRAA